MRKVSTSELANVSGGTGAVEAAIVIGAIATTAIVLDALTSPYYYSTGYYTSIVYDPYPYYYDYGYDIVIYEDYYYY